ncbi:glycosyltransferase [Palleronia sediminis]|uniref:Glycosyltransferase n=1 Tax=Palleronia sediminis TaxID=2547833 RepID=A0A4R6ABA9_9RHOB|nr:glycosyltransferase [Palleronia sediminis]TDL81110.1 glycosyltransferase [Palleronia sediminis]
MKIAVIVCSVGRPDCLRDLMPALAAQSRPADRVVLVVTRPEDAGFDPAPLFPEPTRAELILAPRGLPQQRNRGLDAVSGDCDAVLFLDDDFVPSRHALRGVEAGFDAWPDVAGMTGRLIADGIHGAGFDMAEAARMVADHDARTPAPPEGRAPRILRRGMAGLYGCNMAYRMAAVGGARFDERLPLYAWQEDIDFAARVGRASGGDLVRTDAFSGVHRGAKSGRERAGRRLGYSQLANPWYLWNKGTMTARFAGRLALRNMLANHARSLRPEPWIDRAGRARGNWLALWDILRGRSDPGRILGL